MDQNSLEVLDVLHGLIQDSHLGKFLDWSCCRNMLAKGLKTFIDSLYSFSLSFVPFYCLQILRRFYFVPMNRMKSH